MIKSLNTCFSKAAFVPVCFCSQLLSPAAGGHAGQSSCAGPVSHAKLVGAGAELLSACCAALSACVSTVGSASEGELTTATPYAAKLCVSLLPQPVLWNESIYTTSCMVKS